jgi:hypothetical protein
MSGPKLSRITNRDVQRGGRAMRGLERREIESIFDHLEALGWVFRTPGPYISCRAKAAALGTWWVRWLGLVFANGANYPVI